MIRVCVAGATGWVGKPLVEAIQGSSDLELAAAVSRKAAGRQLGQVTVAGSVAEALATPFDVLVDFTSASAVKANVLAAIAARRHVVIGSSGLTDADLAELDAAAKASSVGVVAVGNFAITAALLQRFAVESARHLASWEILDVAAAEKVDAPSGTARELAARMAEVRRPDIAVPIGDVVGSKEARGAELAGSRVHSVRLPGYTIGVEVRFGLADERLTLTYDGGPGAGPYLRGSLLAIRKVASFRGLVRGMDALLG